MYMINYVISAIIRVPTNQPVLSNVTTVFFRLLNWGEKKKPFGSKIVIGFRREKGPRKVKN